MSDLVEIKGLVEKVNETLVPLRAEVDALKSRDVIDQAKLDKMAADVTAKMQALNDAQAKELAAIKAAQVGALTKPGGDSVETKGKLDEFLRKEGVKGQMEIRAMSTDSNPDGGYLVLPEMSNTVVSRIFETSPLRLVANVEITGSKSRTFLIDDDEGTAEWAGEKAAATEDTPDVGELEIVAHNVRAKMNATADMLADAYVDLAGWLVNKGADKIARTENTAFFTGNGVSKPRGLLTYSAWASAGTYERDKIEQVASGGASSITADGLIGAQASLKEGYQARATWLMKRASYGDVLKLKGSDQFYFGPMLLKDGQAQITLLGKPVIFCDDMQANGTGNNLAIAYGDFARGYTILDRVGLQVLRDPYTAHPYTIFHLTRRTGGAVTNFDAIKLVKIAAS
jgi:HK97 family phage major capsid protein